MTCPSRPARRTRSLIFGIHKQGDVTLTGKIKTVIRERGFGFIDGDDGQTYFFLHSRVKERRFLDLAEGDTVTFDATSHEKGLRAENVSVLDERSNEVA